MSSVKHEENEKRPTKRKIGVFHAKNTEGNPRTIAVDVSVISSISVTRETNEALMFTLDQSGRRGRVVLADSFMDAISIWMKFVDVVIFKRDAGDGIHSIPLALDAETILSIDTSHINGDTLVKTTSGNIPVMNDFDEAVSIWQG